MKFSHSLSALALLVAAEAATVPTSPWTTLTPTATLPASASALTDFDGSFALSIKTLSGSGSAATTSAAASTTSSSAAATTSKGKRAVQQIGDGQVQDQTTKTAASVLNQITDGQVQQQPKATAASVINQIGDGQVQQQTKASVVNQIGDGQVQQQTKASVVNQIGDGQVQQQTKAPVTTASVVNQIGDGQAQQQTKKSTATGVASQIGDGQIQQTKTTAAGQASQVSDGQLQATDGSSTGNTILETCVDTDALTVTLKGGELRDSKGRIGAIVANRQFQFDGPPPQAGTIYAGGWSLVASGTPGGYKLALGNSSIFYKCLSGDFYNLYDQSIGSQCSPIEIDILKAVQC